MNTSDKAIKVENICKPYRIGTKEKMKDSISGAILDFFKNPLKNFSEYRSLYNFNDIKTNHHYDDNDSPNIVWALKNISFDVTKGERLGIIGKNGAGKSTLLKILCRITNPTSGYAKIYGRVSSLLEVGTGFHQELTGRENVYLNAVILGMKKKEVDKKFDQIVDFSGVDKFIDTPVKRYSSGMKVRLAFSVAAHLEPEILIVDEVLAVGDADFQDKCLNRMESDSTQGRTVIFVSHHMPSIVKLCNRVIWLNDGQIKMIGEPTDVISAYLADGKSNNSIWENSELRSIENEKKIAIVTSVTIKTFSNNPTSIVEFIKPFKIHATYHIFQSVYNVAIVCRILDSYGSIVFTSWDTDCGSTPVIKREPGIYSVFCEIPGHFLSPGRYSLTIGIINVRNQIAIDWHEKVLKFEVSKIDFPLNIGRRGIVTPKLRWLPEAHL